MCKYAYTVHIHLLVHNTCFAVNYKYTCTRTHGHTNCFCGVLKFIHITQSPEMVFQPSLDQDAVDGFYNMVDGLLDDIFKFASLIPRVATHLEAQDYRTDLDEVSAGV